MKRFALILGILFALGGAARYHPSHDPPPIEPTRPRIWRVVIPAWHPTRATARMGDRERWESQQNDRRVVSGACDAAGVTYCEASEVRRLSLILTLRKGQHRPSGEAIWPAIEDALAMCGRVAVEATRGGVAIERSGGGEFGTEVIIEGVR